MFGEVFKGFRMTLSYIVHQTAPLSDLASHLVGVNLFLQGSAFKLSSELRRSECVLMLSLPAGKPAPSSQILEQVALENQTQHFHVHF